MRYYCTLTGCMMPFIVYTTRVFRKPVQRQVQLELTVHCFVVPYTGVNCTDCTCTTAAYIQSSPSAAVLFHLPRDCIIYIYIYIAVACACTNPIPAIGENTKSGSIGRPRFVRIQCRNTTININSSSRNNDWVI